MPGGKALELCCRAVCDMLVVLKKSELHFVQQRGSTATLKSEGVRVMVRLKYAIATFAVSGVARYRRPADTCNNVAVGRCRPC